MRYLKLLILFVITCIFISSCSSSTSVATEVDMNSAPEIKTPTITITTLAKPTYTKTPAHTSTTIPIKTLIPSDQPGLIVTLGEKVPSPWHWGVPVFSPDGRIIAHASSRIRFWNVDTYELVQELINPYAEGCAIADAKFSPNGKYFAASINSCWKEENRTGHLLVWDMSTNKVIQDWPQEDAHMPGPGGNMNDYVIPVDAMVFLPNDTGVVFANGNTLEIRDVLDSEKYDVIKLGPKMYITQISTSSDGRLVYIIMSWTKDHNWPALWTQQNKFQIWNINTHAMLLERKYPEGWVNISLNLAGTRLIKVDYEKGTSEILNLETNDIQDLPYRNGWQYYNSDGSLVLYARLLSSYYDEQGIELWNTDNWRNIYTFMPNFGANWIYGMHGMVFSPDNTILAIEHQEQVSLWNIRPIVQP